MKEGEEMFETIEDLIRKEAYSIYLTRLKYHIPGDKEGVGDWMNAEDKVRHKLVEDVIDDAVRNHMEGGY